MRYLRFFSASFLVLALYGCNMQVSEFANNSNSTVSNQVCNSQDSLVASLISVDCG